MSCLFLVVQLFLFPVIFTSRMLLNTEHRLEYFCYLVIRSNNDFQAHFHLLPLSYQIIAILINFLSTTQKKSSETDPAQLKQRK